VFVGIFFSSGHYFISDSFAQNSEESLGTSAVNTASIVLSIFVILIIPIIIILAILWGKGKLTGSQLKFSLIGLGVFFLVVFAVGFASVSTLSNEGNAGMAAEREEDEW